MRAKHVDPSVQVVQRVGYPLTSTNSAGHRSRAGSDASSDIPDLGVHNPNVWLGPIQVSCDFVFPAPISHFFRYGRPTFSNPFLDRGPLSSKLLP